MKILEDAFEKFAPHEQDFSQIWKLIGIQDGIAISYDPFTITAVAYFPSTFMKNPSLVSEQLEVLLRTFISAPAKSYMNSYLIKFFEKPNLPALQKTDHEILRFLEIKRNEKIGSMDTPNYLPFISVTIPIDVKYSKKDTSTIEMLKSLVKKGKIKKSALNELLTSPDTGKPFRDGIDTLKSIMEQIKHKFSGGSEMLNSETLRWFLSCLLNHSKERTVSGLASLFATDAFAYPEKGVVKYNGLYHSTISARTKDLPSYVNEEFSWLFYDESLKNIPFNIQTQTSFPEMETARKEAQIVINRIDAASAVFNPFKKMLAHKREIMQEAIDSLMTSNGRIVDFSFTITTWAETVEELEQNRNTLKNVLRGREMGMTMDTFNLKAAFHSQVPWVNRNKINTRLTNMNAECLMPLVYPMIYINKGELKEPVYFHTRYDQLTSLEGFDKRCSVWNGVITGQSGTGKSFLANYLMMAAATYGSKLFVIDKGGEGGGSFRNLIMNLKGTYVELDFSGKQKFAVNPFDGPMFYSIQITGKDEEGIDIVERNPDINGSTDPERVTFLTGIITLMVQDSEDERLNKTKEEFLQALLEEAYKAHNNNLENTLTISVFANDFLFPLLSNPRKIKNIGSDLASEWARFFYDQMSKFINQGIYAQFFTKTQDLSEQDVFCFDLEGIDEHPDLKSILTTIIVNYCYSLAMDGNPGRKKMILIDEAWALLGGGRMTAVIEGIWRTIRKHGGRIYCCTQDFETIMKSPAGEAIMRNSTYFYMLGANYSYETLSKVKATGQTGVKEISEYDYSIIRTHQFNKGLYSEFFFLNPVFAGTLRFRPSNYDYYLSTTDPEDKDRLNQIKRRLGVKHVNPDVLEEMIGKKK